MGGNSSQIVNPYRRFTLVLGFSLVLLGLTLSGVTLWACSDYVSRNTVELTSAAVTKHFSMIPQLSGLFAGDSDASGEPADSDGEHAPAAGGASPVSSPEYDQLNAIIRMHFDLYSIVQADLYDKEGRVVFSYDRSRVGDTLDGRELETLHRTISSAEVVHGKQPDYMLQLWIPIQREDGHVVGVVEVIRDISEHNRQIGWLQGILLTVIVLGMLGLYWVLHRVFSTTTCVINQQNRELGSLVAVIERTYDESLQALSSALDSRDNETQGHSFRVTSYALRLGVEMNLQGEELGYLARGALLHDVGKIGVPDSILLKPSKLTEEEWIVMKSHVELGYQMLQHISFLAPSLDVVRYHHERWDGQGYPYRLKGEEIPLFARIFAVCDTYDAMTSDRPYRKGWGYAEARAEIERCKGTQFCPEVAEAFLRIPPEEWQGIELLSRSSEPGELVEEMLRQAAGTKRAG